MPFENKTPILPATYGEAMRKFDPALLPQELLSLDESDPVFYEWVRLADTVRRAEKVSCWTQWTSAQSAAYDAGDLVQFSRLRGYTEAEIADFSRFMILERALESRYGDGFCEDVEYVCHQLVETEELRAINRELCRMSDAALNDRSFRDLHSPQRDGCDPFSSIR